MLNQSKEVLCICFSFQESRDSIKKNQKRTFMRNIIHEHYHIGGYFEAV